MGEKREILVLVESELSGLLSSSCEYTNPIPSWGSIPS